MRETTENSRSLPRERTCPFSLSIIADNEPLGRGVGNQGKGKEDQMSAESSGVKDSRDGWDGLGHQVSALRLSHTEPAAALQTSLFSLDNMT